jgi:hypothetical protein
MERRSDWQRALDEFLRAHETRRFEYGRWDCCLFVCDAIVEMTATDLAASYRGRYTSRAGAMHALAAQLGVASVEAVAENAAKVHGMPQVPVERAQRGDMVLVERRRDYSLGLVALNGMEVIVTSERGLWRLPLSCAVKAWHV